MDVLVVDVFLPHHTTYLERDSVAHTIDTYGVLLVATTLRPPSYDLRTRSGFTIDALDVVEHILGRAVLLVLDDGQHVRCS
jgi:hypothetical protein